jgi:uncharacterized membrane protein
MEKVDTKKVPKFAKVIPVILIICGAIGLIMSFAIMYEELKLDANPAYVPSCNLNPVIACGSVMKSGQAHIFGFSNPIIGLAAFPVLITSGVVLLSGAKLKRWYWLGLEGGAIFGVGFIHWLFFETVYRIHALCPYCMGAWIVTITTFWYVTLYNLNSGNIKVRGQLKRLTNFLTKHHLDILILWFLIIAGLILKHFWYYYGQHL